MTFSIIIPTRDRPALLRRALESAVRQTCARVEVIVVDDGSMPGVQAETAAIIAEAGPRARLHTLPKVQGGHGPAYSRNIGVSLASGQYVGFLDDDDEWIDLDYLARVERVIADRCDLPDLHFAGQMAVENGQQVLRPIWTEDLGPVVQATLPAEGPETYRVHLPLLMRSIGFCHLNTTLVRRDFLLGMGGFDACLRYESDRDFYFRAIDAARVILYSPTVVACHYVPDKTRRDNASTSPTELQRRLFQLRLLDKAILFSANPAVQAYGRQHKTYTLKNITALLVQSGDYERALFYGREAAVLDFNAKWLGYLLWIYTRRISSRFRLVSRTQGVQTIA